MRIKHAQKRFYRAVPELHDVQCNVVATRHLNSSSNPASAAIMDLSIEALESPISRAKHKLSNILKSHNLNKDILIGEKDDELGTELGIFSPLPNGNYKDPTKICKTVFLLMQYARKRNLSQNLRAYPFLTGSGVPCGFEWCPCNDWARNSGVYWRPFRILAPEWSESMYTCSTPTHPLTLN